LTSVSDVITGVARRHEPDELAVDQGTSAATPEAPRVPSAAVDMIAMLVIQVLWMTLLAFFVLLIVQQFS
jgi:hypothetical protein